MIFKKSKYFFLFVFLFSCSSGILKYEKVKDIFKNEEFEKKVLIKPVEVKTVQTAPTVNEAKQTELKSEVKPVASIKESVVLSQKKSKKLKAKSEKNKPVEIIQRQPDLEDSEGFIESNRRPIIDPYKVGEKVVHSVSYFAAQAGLLTLSVGPYLEVNGKKSYNFKTEIKSSRLFSNFYSVDDQVETFVDYNELVPHVFKLQIKESGQLREAQSFFDQSTLKANYWENKYTEKNGHEEKKLDWDLQAYSQNVFSAIFYMRLFKWTIGKEYAFRVSDDGKNVVFKAKALERVKLNTDAGVFNAIKIKAEVVSRGALTQAGDLFFWLSDDDRKYILRIEAKIKIGTLVSEVVEIDPG